MHPITLPGLRVALAPSLIRRVALAAVVAVATCAQAQPTPESVSTRGQLLYSTHCIGCHTTQMHWRAQRQARDWDTLKVQVRRWQGTASLGWSEADIDEVARYLNDTIYKFSRPVGSVGGEPGFLAAGMAGRTRWAAIAPLRPAFNAGD